MQDWLRCKSIRQRRIYLTREAENAPQSISSRIVNWFGRKNYVSAGQTRSSNLKEKPSNKIGFSSPKAIAPNEKAKEAD